VVGEIKKFRNLDELSESLAREIAALINKEPRTNNYFSLALSGGNTPRTLYHLLGTTYAKSVPWSNVHIFFCDERYVPQDDKQSNYRMVKETLLDSISIPQGNIHPIPTGSKNSVEAAEFYEQDLRKYFADHGATFDLVLLGMGKEGHTASLFPNSSALDEKKKWTAAVEVQAVPPKRITLTYPILNRATRIYFLVSGSDKKDVLTKILNDAADFQLYPASGIHPQNGKMVWWIDSAALPD